MSTKKLQILGTFDSNAVLYTEQDLTSEQQAQVRENIGIAQSDWSQNDENAVDYVKGRTHWKSIDVVEEIHNGTISFSSVSTDTFGTGQEVFYKYFTISSFATEGILPLIISITVDGTKYEICPESTYGSYDTVLESGERFRVKLSYRSYTALDFYVTSGLVDSEFVIAAVDEVVHKIDREYLPDDAINVNPDWDQYDSSQNNFILNRTHGTFYGVHDCCDGVLNFSRNSGLGYQSPVIDIGAINQPTSVTVYVDEVSYEVPVVSQNSLIESNKVAVGNEYVTALCAYQGYWVIYIQCTEGLINSIFRVVAEGTYTAQLDEKYIPDTIARSSEIPDAVVNPSTADVGQTLVVKAVDENGKPTEWECVTSQIVPATTVDDNGKFLRVVNNVAAWQTVPNAEEVYF